MIEVYPVESKVIIDGDLEARVLAVQIDHHGVRYLVVWWDERKRVEEWVLAFEVRSGPEKVPVGFLSTASGGGSSSCPP